MYPLLRFVLALSSLSLSLSLSLFPSLLSPSSRNSRANFGSRHGAWECSACDGGRRRLCATEARHAQALQLVAAAVCEVELLEREGLLEGPPDVAAHVLAVLVLSRACASLFFFITLLSIPTPVAIILLLLLVIIVVVLIVITTVLLLVLLVIIIIIHLLSIATLLLLLR